MKYHWKCIRLWLVFWWNDVVDIVHGTNLDKQQGFICLECGIKYPRGKNNEN